MESGRPFERIWPHPVIQHVQSKPGHRSHENAALWAHREHADINGRKIDEAAITKARIINKD